MCNTCHSKAMRTGVPDCACAVDNVSSDVLSRWLDDVGSKLLATSWLYYFGERGELSNLTSYCYLRVQTVQYVRVLVEGFIWK